MQEVELLFMLSASTAYSIDYLGKQSEEYIPRKNQLGLVIPTGKANSAGMLRFIYMKHNTTKLDFPPQIKCE